MKRMRYAYALTLAFSAPVSWHTFLFRFDPPSDARQQVWGRRLRSTPGCALPLTQDAFGNACALGHIEGAKTAQVNALCVYDILNCDKFVVVKGAVEKLEEVYA